MNYLFTKCRIYFSRILNKTRKERSRLFSFIVFVFLGLGSLIWFLIRVIPKPSRATYPCVRATAPLASAFVIYLLGITATFFSVKKFRHYFRMSKYTMALLFLAGAALSGFLTIPFTPGSARPNIVNIQEDPNNPIGIAKGIFPGRVVWVYDRNATDSTCTNTAGDYWFQNTDLPTVESMLSKGIRQLAGKNDIEQAWNDVFIYYNQNHGKGSVGYTAGEKIYIKINLTTSGSSGYRNLTEKLSWLDHMDATPQLCLAILRQLVNVVGVQQSDIYLGDPYRKFHDVYWDMMHPEFPDVHYMDGFGYNGREQTVPTSEALMKFSDGQYQSRLPQEYVNAAYFINMSCLKTHNEGGITMGAKNHQGSIIASNQSPSEQYAYFMHYSLPANSQGYGKYRHTVDYLGHEQLGGKTLFYIVDGIWAGRNWEGIVEKWQMAPFSNDYPNSLFLSQDPVAIESVGFDFLLEEYKNKASNIKYPYISGVDDYLFQSADSSYWPDNINYDPEGDGSILPSLGVKEHWNDPLNKQYSRNLKTGNGIELLLVDSEKIIISSTLTAENSDLPDNNVNVIYVDSSNVKWIGTHEGLARYDDSTWTVFVKNDTLANGDVVLLNGNIKDIAYERTAYGTELWMATDSGLTVASYNLDGITSATTYHKDNSSIAGNNVSNVAVDIRHNRWIATDSAISVFRGDQWASIDSFKDVNHQYFKVSDYAITDIESYDIDSQAFISTAGKGIARMSYDAVDGFTGASAYGQPWSYINSDNVQAIAVKGEAQWYGTDDGAAMHNSHITKEGWTQYKTDSGLVNNNVVAVFVDKDNNIWYGTTEGLTVHTGADWYNYTEEEGLINNTINHITSDMNGNIWVATPAGIELFSYIPGLVVLRAPGLISPANNSTDIEADIMLTWNPVSGAIAYMLQVDTAGDFVNPAHVGEDIYTTTYSLSGLDNKQQYFWRVAATRAGSEGPWSEYWNFTTKDEFSSIPASEAIADFIVAYPNPANDYIYLQGRQEKTQIRVNIYTISGQLIATPVDFYNYGKDFRFIMDISDKAKYPTGVYIMQVTGETFSKKIKFTIL
ncbi:MAG: DUF362 domain-containing protein [Bacteroidales bacterium]|nr:DUF362 domain-containing protein [Bacteroidales bacterium]